MTILSSCHIVDHPCSYNPRVGNLLGNLVGLAAHNPRVGTLRVLTLDGEDFHIDICLVPYTITVTYENHMGNDLESSMFFPMF